MNDKFVWQEQEISFLTEEYKTKIKKYNSHETPYETCERCNECFECDEEDRDLGRKLAEKIFLDLSGNAEQDKSIAEKIILNCEHLCRKLLPEGYVLTKQLHCCTKMRLFELFVEKNMIAKMRTDLIDL